MARKRSPTLTDAELRLMHILWRRGASTVGDVLEALPRGAAPAYSTVRTILRILETKGYVTHRQEGRAFVYEPVVAQSEARRSALRDTMNRFFEGSPELLVLNLLKQEAGDAEAVQRLRRLIEDGDDEVGPE